MKLVDGEKLLRAIKVMSPVSNYAPEKVPPMNKLVEKEDVLLFIRNCPVSPAQLADENLKALAMLEELKTLLMEMNLHPTEIACRQQVLKELRNLESRARSSDLVREIGADREKAEAWDEVFGTLCAMIGELEKGLGAMKKSYHHAKLLTQSKTPPTAEEGKKDETKPCPDGKTREEVEWEARMREEKSDEP